MYLHFRLMCFKEGKLNKNTHQKKGWRVAKGVFLCKKTCAQSSLLLLKVMGCRLLGNWVISFKSIDLYWCIQFEALAQSLLKRSQTRRDFIFLFSAFSFVNAFGQRTCDYELCWLPSRCISSDTDVIHCTDQTSVKSTRRNGSWRYNLGGNSLK